MFLSNFIHCVPCKTCFTMKFFKGKPRGFRATPWWGPGAKPPEAHEFK